MLSRVRALPNPAFKSATGQTPHPLTLHLTPTSTANIAVTSLIPSPSASAPFVKIAPNAEVIVAPKLRAKTTSGSGKDTKSIDGRSTASTTKTKSRRSEGPVRNAIFLRGVHRNTAEHWFDEEDEIDKDEGFKIWIDWSVLNSGDMRSVSWASISVVRPTGFQDSHKPQPNPAEDVANIKPAVSVVAKVCQWKDAPNSQHVALSSLLYTALDCAHTAGEMIRVEAAQPPIPKATVKTIRVHPFATSSDGQKNGFQFGGKSKANREDAAREIVNVFGSTKEGNKLLDGPLTDGMLLPALQGFWEGGIMRFDPAPGALIDKAKSTRGWLLGSERKLAVKSATDTPGQTSSSKLFVELVGETTKPEAALKIWSVGEPIPFVPPNMVGIDPLIVQLASHIRHGSSVLLTGGRGSGRTTLSQLLAHRFEKDFYHTTYFPCRTLFTGETRVSTIYETLTRLFGLATWSARNGGHALIILDDLDAICPVETEQQVGGENGRSRHVSEIIISMVRQHCSSNSRTTLLAIAKSKEDVNNVIIGGHVVREIINLPAPDKETRRTVLESFVTMPRPELQPQNLKPDERQLSTTTQRASGFFVNPSIDFLDLAGQTDGYMPGDLQLLVSRARSEALIRVMSILAPSPNSFELTSIDFTSALKGFTPTSLRNVTLQHSTTTFSSIGGLRETRQILLETLQYPTLYAPIFARCPLRLRSGLLLYGYPGCGKTLLASAVAGECGLNFISVKGPEILNKYIGASEKSVRDLFERAQAARPCVLFFDEFDSVAPKRGHDSTGVTDRVVNQLLTQMDGAEGLSGVYVLAATSRPDLIDPALLRPGRLDKSLLCDMPDLEDRLDILRALSKKLKISPKLLATDAEADAENIEAIARQTEGYSGADLQAVIYNAHLEAIHDVLGDRDVSTKSGKNRPASTSAATNGQSSVPDFTYFRLGQKAEEGDEPVSATGKASERAKIAAQLSSYRTTQHRVRLAARKPFIGMEDAGRTEKSGEEAGNKEPVIEWRHIEKSLAQTRPSVSGEERRRLNAIYREFVVGRNGEMPNGQGGNEIGGRSSLM